jgi:hypothetical protein
MKPRIAVFCLVVQASALLVAGDWSDRKEYDIVLTIRSESSPQKRLALLDSWSKSYPKTGLARARQELYLSAYESMGDHAHMFDVSKQMLAGQPDDPVSLYWLTVLAPQHPGVSTEIIDDGDNAAHKLLANSGQYFTNDKKPASVSDADWQKQKIKVEVLAQRTIGWANWQRGKFSAAADDLSACLKKDPGNAEISSWLGIVSGLDTNKQPEALWHLARATNTDLAYPLPESERRQVNTMLENVYASYHGSPEGLDQLRKLSAGNAFPPPEFSIDPATVVNARRAEAELSLTNPELAAWLAVRRQLEAANGEAYFASDLQGKPLPRLRGTVLRSNTSRTAREMTLSMGDAGTPDVSLKIIGPLTFSTPTGAAIAFQGMGESFVKSPFLLQVTADAAQVENARTRTP